MKRLLKVLIVLIFPIYLGFCLYLYLMQESLIFNPEELDKDHVFDFDQPFKEIYLKTPDNIMLHGLWFTVKEPKGAILYLHGNTGTMEECGLLAKHYTDTGHDVFMIDYRGYGKSEGDIFSEQQFFDDVQLAYDKLKSEFEEDKITIIGYSVGTGSAAMLAANNHPKQLILKAPYYSILDMTERRYPIAPTFLLKYKFRTHKYIQNIAGPITVFHGDEDERIYFGSSLKLQKKFRTKDKLVKLVGQDHDDLEANPEYMKEIQLLLN